MNTLKTRHVVLAAGLLGLALTAPLTAQSIPAMDRGWYSSTDFHAPTNTTYFVGNCSSCPFAYFNNWFVFDLSGVDEVITGASLMLWNPNNFVSGDLTENFQLFDVSTPIDDLISSFGGLGVFADLGSGTSYGSYTLTPASSGAQVTIPLNAAGLAALNAGLGERVAMGGSITTLDGSPGTQEVAFGGTPTYNGAVHLILETSGRPIDAMDSGWYSSTDIHNPNNTNYVVGNCPNCASSNDFNNWFVFDLSGTSGLVTGATLALENPLGYGSGDPTETYEIFAVSTSITDLTAGIGGVGTFDDLGSGISYGSYQFTSADTAPIGVVGTIPLVTISLNAAGLAALNGAMGGQFAIGGAITTLDSDPTTAEQAFGNTGISPNVVQLVLEVEDAWTYLAGGTLGSAGQPLLTGSGSLVGGTQASVTLASAPPDAAMLAWIAFMPTPFPALGGTVHAFPFVNQINLFADVDGAFAGATTWPGGAPPGTNVWFQFLVQDDSSIHGITLSNGLLATTP
jgi:Fe-S cluster biogenesis protein NfuA